jgi:hypothetical protein
MVSTRCAAMVEDDDVAGRAPAPQELLDMGATGGPVIESCIISGTSIPLSAAGRR